MSKQSESWIERISGWLPRWKSRNDTEIKLDDRSTISAPAALPVRHRLMELYDEGRRERREDQQIYSDHAYAVGDHASYSVHRQHSTPYVKRDREYRARDVHRSVTESESETEMKHTYREKKDRRRIPKSKSSKKSIARQTRRDYYNCETEESDSNGDNDLCQSFEHVHVRNSRPEPKKRQTEKLANKKIKDPKSFDGVKIEWSDYFKHFEAVASWNEWSAEQKAKQLVMSFEGEAIKLLGELSDEILGNYKLLIQEMNRRYDPTERAQAWKIEFRNRMRRPNEPITQFAQNLNRLALKAFPNMPTNAQQQWVLDQFTMGIGNIELQRHVQFGHPNSLNEAISLAIEFEAFEAGRRIDKPINREPELYTVTAEITQNSQQNDNSTQRNVNDANNSSSVTCFYCKKPGHMVRECPKLKYKQEKSQTTWQNQPPVMQSLSPQQQSWSPPQQASYPNAQLNQSYAPVYNQAHGSQVPQQVPQFHAHPAFATSGSGN